MFTQDELFKISGALNTQIEYCNRRLRWVRRNKESIDDNHKYTGDGSAQDEIDSYKESKAEARVLMRKTDLLRKKMIELSKDS